MTKRSGTEGEAFGRLPDGGLGAGRLWFSSGDLRCGGQVERIHTHDFGLKKASWSKRITVNYSKTAVHLRSDGISSHSRPAYCAVPNAGVVVPGPDTAQVAADPTTAQNYDFSIPVKPKWSSTTTAAPLGSIGMMISGRSCSTPTRVPGPRWRWRATSRSTLPTDPRHRSWTIAAATRPRR